MIITISREFGSGGREIGKRLADELHIAYYDQEILRALANEMKLDEAYLEKVLQQKVSNSFPLTYSKTLSFYSNTASCSMMAEQHKIIQKLAEKGDCVIVGRGSDVILRDYHPFNIFVYASVDSKLKRCRERSLKDEHLSDHELLKKMKQIDKARAENRYLFSSTKWGDKSNYDVCINTSHVDIKEIIHPLACLIKAGHRS